MNIDTVASAIGLNPIWFEKRFQALYDVYAAHMGLCKEAANVATQHAIQDLWEEAAACNVMPPPPLTMPAVTMNSARNTSTILCLSMRCLSGVARKSPLE